MSATGKTPISLLGETLVHKGIQPLFNLIRSGAGTNHGTFVYEVIGGDLVKAQGRGKSKKEAKQDAAKEALKVLKLAREAGPAEMRDKDDLLPISQDVISPYQEEFRENAVGKLGELCAVSELPLPAYYPVREDGPPHAKTFEISCQVSNFEQSGRGRTKQQAKQKAAKAMLDKLEILNVFKLEVPGAECTNENGEKEEQNEQIEQNEQNELLLDEIRAQRLARGLTKTMVNRRLLGQQMGTSVKHDWTPEKLEEAKMLRVPTTQFLAQLQAICQVLELKMSVSSIVALEEAGSVRVIILAATPELSFLGQGPNDAAADNKAAERALGFFDIVVCR